MKKIKIVATAKLLGFVVGNFVGFLFVCFSLLLFIYLKFMLQKNKFSLSVYHGDKIQATIAETNNTGKPDCKSNSYFRQN